MSEDSSQDWVQIISVVPSVSWISHWEAPQPMRFIGRIGARWQSRVSLIDSLLQEWGEVIHQYRERTEFDPRVLTQKTAMVANASYPSTGEAEGFVSLTQRNQQNSGPSERPCLKKLRNDTQG